MWTRSSVGGSVAALVDEPRPGALRKVNDAQVEQVVMQTLESTPRGQTHWSARSLAKATGLSVVLFSTRSLFRGFLGLTWANMLGISADARSLIGAFAMTSAIESCESASANWSAPSARPQFKGRPGRQVRTANFQAIIAPGALLCCALQQQRFFWQGRP